MPRLKKFFLTKEGLSRIEQEYQELKKLKVFKTKGESPRIFHSEEVDPEFLAFQEDLELLDTRIMELEMVLKNVQMIVPPAKDKKDIVVLGAIVIVEVDGQEDEFKIVGTLEANPAAGSISNECPVGKSLLDRRVGDEVAIGSDPKVVYKIKAIKHEKLR